MLDAFGAVLPVAVAVALSPFPIIAVVLVLLSPPGGSVGLAFLAGRVVGVAVVVGVFAAVSDVVQKSGDASPLASVVRILVGVALLVLALWKWRGRPDDDEATLPAWMGSIERSSPGRAAVLAFVLSVANPKELLLGVGAGITIGGAGLPLGPTLGVAAAYTVLACVTVAAPVIAFIAAPERMRSRLESLRTMLVRNSAAIMSVLLLVIGALLIGGGLSGLR